MTLVESEQRYVVTARNLLLGDRLASVQPCKWTSHIDGDSDLSSVSSWVTLD